jgi:hypothetical protein
MEVKVIQSDIEVVWASSLKENALSVFPKDVINCSVDGHYVRQAVHHQVSMEIARLVKDNDGMVIYTDSLLEARREARAEGKKFVIIID